MDKWRTRILCALLAVLTFVGVGNWIYDNPNISEETKSFFTVGRNNIAYAVTPDIECDGTDDHVQVQALLDALPSTGGRITIFGGDYDFGSTVTRAIGDVTFEGDGSATYVANNGSTALFTDGGENWSYINLSTDAGGIDHGAYDTWIELSITINAVHYAYRVGDDISTSWGGSSDYAPIAVAASDASAKEQVIAVASGGAVCDGTSDEVELEAADALAEGGRVILLGHDFYISAAGVDIAYSLVDGVTQGSRDFADVGVTFHVSGASTLDPYLGGRLHNVLIDKAVTGAWDVLTVDPSGGVGGIQDVLYNVSVDDYYDEGHEKAGDGVVFNITSFPISVCSFRYHTTGFSSGTYIHTSGSGHFFNANTLDIRMYGATNNLEILAENSGPCVQNLFLLYSETSGGTYDILNSGGSALTFLIYYNEGEPKVSDDGNNNYTTHRGLGWGGTVLTYSDTSPTLTINGGHITIRCNVQEIAAETGVTDDLTHIDGGVTGQILVIYPDSGDTITVKDGWGNIYTAGDFVMDDSSDMMVLYNVAGSWFELSRASNG